MSGRVRTLALLGALVFGCPAGAEPAQELFERLPPGARASQATVPAAGLRTLERVGDYEVEYTTDPMLESNLRALLTEREVDRGHILVMDASSGAVFAYLSTDPEAFPPTRAYPAASLMKVVTAAAVLKHAPDAARGPCRYTGNRYALHGGDFTPPREGGVVETFRTALANSNNQCFARFAARDVGETLLVDEIERAGLLEAPAPGHATGEIDSGEGPFDLGRLGSGLAGSFITPLSAARLAALLANGGLVTPHWIARIRDRYGNDYEIPEARPAEAVWTPELTAELREHLISVTRSGTARRAFHNASGSPFLGEISVAGKTGTLSGHAPEGLYQWFIGVAPADEPRIAIATLVVNDPQVGGASASELAAASLWEIFCADGACSHEGFRGLYQRGDARAALARHERTHRDAKRAAALKRAQELARIHNATDLDRPPRPVGSAGLELPWQLRRKKIQGEIVLSVELSAEGEVLTADIDSSDLPEFEAFVLTQVRTWKFTPPTRDGQPVSARARLPIPIRVN